MRAWDVLCHSRLHVSNINVTYSLLRTQTRHKSSREVTLCICIVVVGRCAVRCVIRAFNTNLNETQLCMCSKSPRRLCSVKNDKLFRWAKCNGQLIRCFVSYCTCGCCCLFSCWVNKSRSQQIIILLAHSAWATNSIRAIENFYYQS